MKLAEVGPGIGFGVGGTSYRVADIDEIGEVGQGYVIPTPNTPMEFFGQTARGILDAAHEGCTWAVMGVPGPVKVEVYADNSVEQHFRVTNVRGLKEQEDGFDPVYEMTRTDPAFGRLMEDRKFTFLTVNDGDLAAQAAAYLYGSENGRQYNVVADVINGTGIGGAIVRRDDQLSNEELFHPVSGLWEIGHRPLSMGSPSLTAEKILSGPALAHMCGEESGEDIEPKDPIWRETGTGLAALAIDMAIYGGAELVVMSGGIGIHAQSSYGEYMKRALHDFANSNNPMADKTPDIKVPVRSLADTYELYGARGAIRSHLAKRAITQLIRSAE